MGFQLGKHRLTRQNLTPVTAQTLPSTHTCLVPALLRKGKHGNDEKAGDA